MKTKTVKNFGQGFLAEGQKSLSHIPKRLSLA